MAGIKFTDEREYAPKLTFKNNDAIHVLATVFIMEFSKYIRKQVAEMRPVTDYDIDVYNKHAGELIVMNGKRVVNVSISVEDLVNGSPKSGDMIARNPKNHNDQWLVAEQYFKDNFESV